MNFITKLFKTDPIAVTPHQLLVLKAIASSTDSVPSFLIREWICAKKKWQPTLSEVLPILNELTKLGLIQQVDLPSFYRLTRSGDRTLKHAMQQEGNDA